LDKLDKSIEMGEAAIKPLGEIIRGKESTSNERRTAVEALGRIGNAKAVPLLIEALYDRKKEVRRAAADALDRLKWAPDENENGAAYWVANEKWERCIRFGDKAVRPLIAALRDKNVMDNAVETVSRLGVKALDALIDALRQDDWYLRTGAALALGKTGEVRAINALVTALERGDEAVCLVAPVALGKIGTSQAVEPLMAFLSHEKTAVQRAAAHTLALLYERGNIDSKSKSRILAQWKVIRQYYDENAARR